MSASTPVTPTATFTFHLKGWGWAEAHFKSGDVALDFEISYLCHPLADLLEALEELIREGGEYRLEWAGEPWGYKWRMETMPAGKVGITVSFTPDGSRGGETEWKRRGEVVTDLRDLARQVAGQAEAILRAYGFAGYALHWNGSEFPVARLLALRALLDEREWFGPARGENPLSSLAEELAYLADLTARTEETAPRTAG